MASAQAADLLPTVAIRCTALAELGVIFLMFLIGLEVSPSERILGAAAPLGVLGWLGAGLDRCDLHWLFGSRVWQLSVGVAAVMLGLVLSWIVHTAVVMRLADQTGGP